jgi:hypothetical protein
MEGTDKLHPNKRSNTTKNLETLQLQVGSLFGIILKVDPDTHYSQDEG